MELRELGIIYTKVPNFHNYSDGMISELFIIHKNDKAIFLVNIDFKDSKGKKKTGLFNFDLDKKRINCLCKDDCIEYLDYLDLINEHKTFNKIKKYIENNKTDNLLVEYDNNFVYVDNDSKAVKAKSESKITFCDNKISIKNEVCVLHGSSGLNTNVVQIDNNLIKKENFLNIDYSTKVDIFIKINEKKYTDFGNVKSIIINENKISFLIEPLEASLLSKSLFGNLNFNKISAGEIVNVMMKTTQAAKIGEIEGMNNVKRKFKYITILNNFDIQDSEIFIGDLVLSKKIKEIDINKIKPSSSKYIYVSIYVVAENISDARDEAIKKINNIKNFIELLEKNSCIYQMYNKGNSLTNWDIDKLFIDYRLSDQFYIYNIFDSSQFVYGSNKCLTVKNYGLLKNENEILKYKDRIEKILYNYCEKENKLFNAMLWLNKSLELINSDLYQSIIYINVAIEYATNNEKCTTLEEDYPEITEIMVEIRNLINDKDLTQNVKTIINNKISSVINDSSINKRFYSMLKRLNIEVSERHIENYQNIRKARNDIIHNNNEINITKHDIIDCYILVSKIIFYKITEGQNEYI